MSAQVYFVPGQTEGRRNAFLEWTVIDLSSKLSLTRGDNVKYCKSVHHPLTLPMWEYRIPWQFSKQISKLLFQMSAQIHSVTSQNEGRRNVFLEWTTIGLSSKVFLTCGGNVSYYKTVHHPISTLPVGIGNTITIFKTNQ